MALTEVKLAASSVAEELGYIALSDVSTIRIDGSPLDFRLIGGQMVALHAQRWEMDLPRLTQDADIALQPVTIRTTNVLEQLRNLGYSQVEGNRYSRTISDIPVGRSDGLRTATIDILVPATTSRARDTLPIGEEIVTTEVLGLAPAFLCEPINLQIQLLRLNGSVLDFQVLLPDELSGLVQKAYVWRTRAKSADAIDMWRMLEVCFVAGITSERLTTEGILKGASIVRQAFADPAGSAMQQLIAGTKLGEDAGMRRYTRIQALMKQVLGEAETTSA